MSFGLQKNEYDFLTENLVTPLKRSGASLWIYGSRARGDHQKFSDIDIMVDFKSGQKTDPQTEARIRKKIGEILEYFEKSNFPYKVELVYLKDFAPSYLPSFEDDKIAL